MFAHAPPLGAHCGEYIRLHRLLERCGERHDRCFARPEGRKRYVEGLATVLKPGGRLFLLCFSDEEPGTEGARRVSKQALHDAFAQGWAIESIEPKRYEVRPDLKDLTFSEGGRKAWLAVIRREA